MQNKPTEVGRDVQVDRRLGHAPRGRLLELLCHPVPPVGLAGKVTEHFQIVPIGAAGVQCTRKEGFEVVEVQPAGKIQFFWAAFISSQPSLSSASLEAPKGTPAHACRLLPAMPTRDGRLVPFSETESYHHHRLRHAPSRPRRVSTDACNPTRRPRRLSEKCKNNTGTNMAELEIHHEGEHGSDPMGQKVGILAAVLAVGLALVSISSHRT